MTHNWQRLLVASLVVVAAAACTSYRTDAGDLRIDLSPDLRICLADQTTEGAQGTSLLLSLFSGHDGRWTLDRISAQSGRNITVADAWVFQDADASPYGNGFALPPSKAHPDQLAHWPSRRPLAGAVVDGDPARYAVVLQLNRLGDGVGSLSGLVMEYSDATGRHTQTASGFEIALNPAGVDC